MNFRTNKEKGNSGLGMAIAFFLQMVIQFQFH